MITKELDARVVEIATHLLRDDVPFSRNRHYDAFSDPLFAEALRLARRLRALRAALWRAHDRGGRVVVTQLQRGGRAMVRIEIDDLRMRTTAWLEPAVFAALCTRVDVRGWIGVDDAGACDAYGTSGARD